MYLHVYPYDFCVCITTLNNRLQYNVHMHGINVCRHTVTELSRFVDKYNVNSTGLEECLHNWSGQT